MGCCASNSSKAAGEKAENAQFYSNSKQSRTPPPAHPLLEEESVKEVLSETPTLPKKPNVSRTHQQDINEPRKMVHLLPKTPNIPDEKQQKDCILKRPTMVFNPEELLEEASEICSTHSESFSTATYFTEKNDEDAAAAEGIRRRSPVKLRQRSLSGDSKRERVVGKSPAKNSDPNIRRVRTGSGKDARGFGPSVQKRDYGESSGRRSRSPAMRTDSGGSGRRNGKSPGRVRSEVGEKIRKGEVSNSLSSIGDRDNKWPPTNNESLENPLVSLECFIFL